MNASHARVAAGDGPLLLRFIRFGQVCGDVAAQAAFPP
jgi:hypothetical protein